MAFFHFLAESHSRFSFRIIVISGSTVVSHAAAWTYLLIRQDLSRSDLVIFLRSVRAAMSFAVSCPCPNLSGRDPLNPRGGVFPLFLPPATDVTIFVATDDREARAIGADARYLPYSLWDAVCLPRLCFQFPFPAPTRRLLWSIRSPNTRDRFWISR